MSRTLTVILRVLLVLCLGIQWGWLDRESTGAELAEVIDETFDAIDTLAPVKDHRPDAEACLQGLTWKVQRFTVNCEAFDATTKCVTVRFPSPINSGNERNDLVALEWYVACDEQQLPITAPAVIVVHESGSRMAVGRVFAQALRDQGLHAFMVQLPYYGVRREAADKPDGADFLIRMKQAVADVRRARDAVAVLPWIDTRHIALQGTSLGGFVAANSAALDQAFDSVFLLLAGGELHDLLRNGEREAAKVRTQLEQAGLDDEGIAKILWQVEPTRIAHRLDPQRTWLYSGIYDKVVPLRNASALARAARLDRDHHIRLAANHYTGVMFIPQVLETIRLECVGIGD